MWLIPIVVTLVGVGLIVAFGALAYAVSPAAKIRQRADRAISQLEHLQRTVQNMHARASRNVQDAAQGYVQQVRLGRLRAISIDELKNHASGLRLQALKDIGLRTLADLQGWPASRLVQVRGVGPDSATRIASIVAALTQQSNQQPILYPWPGTEGGPEHPLLEAICQLGRIETWFADPDQLIHRHVESFRNRRLGIRAKTTFFKWLFGFGGSADLDAAAWEAVAMERELMGDGELARIFKRQTDYLKMAVESMQSRLPWAVVASDAGARPEYYHRQLKACPGGGAGWKARPQTASPVVEKSPASPSNLQPMRPAAVSRSDPTPSARPIPPLAGLAMPPPDSPATPDLTVRRGGSSQSANINLAPVWIPPGRDVTVNGFTIRGGMVYIGQGLAMLHGGGVEPALINPARPLVPRTADCHIRQVDYWQNYDTISPQARASYLQWLSTGKGDPLADIGYVFLYFYGLERRLLWDALKDPHAKADIPVIEAEITRLLRIYNQSHRISVFIVQ